MTVMRGQHFSTIGKNLEQADVLIPECLLNFDKCMRFIISDKMNKTLF